MTEIVVDDAGRLSAFLKVAPVEKSNGYSSTPILKHFLLVGSPRRVEVRATDLTTTMTQRLVGRGNGSICAPAAVVLKAIKGTTGTLLVFHQASDESPVEMQFGGSSYSLPALKADEYPVCPKPPSNGWFPIRLPDLVPFLAILPRGYAQYENLSVELEADKMSVAATDGHRLSLVRVDGGIPVEKKVHILVPRDAVVNLAKLRREHLFLALPNSRAKKNGNSVIHLRDDGDLRIRIRPSDSTFPDFREVIPRPESAACVIEANRKQLESALQAGLPFVSPLATRVEVGVSLDGKLTVSIQNPDLGGFSRLLDLKSTDIRSGFGFCAGFNLNYLLDAIRSSTAETITVEFHTDEGPLVIREAGKLCMVMPLRD